jgi:hypothetical protein
MNNHDRDNLDFLLSIDAETFKDWYSKMTPDDHDYASELLEKYSQELAERSQALVIEADLIHQNNNYREAMQVISRFL